MNLADVRKSVGSVHKTWEFPGPTPARREDAAGQAYQQMFDASKGISAWRISSPDHERWLVVAMGEESHRPEIEKCEQIAKRYGGEPTELDPPEMLDAMRERRWKTALRSVAAGSDLVEKSHWGPEGAHLYADGRMVPKDA